MAKQVTTTSDSGFSSLNTMRDFKSTVDATGDTAPDTLEALLAAYGSCYVPALRVAANQRGVDDLGAIEIDIEGEIGDDDKLAGTAFHVQVEAEVDEETQPAILERANELCKVHAAIREDLRADVTLETGVA